MQEKREEKSSAQHPDGLKAAKAVAQLGRCLFCEDAVAPGKKWLCRDRECKAAWYRAWHRDARVAHPERYGKRFVKHAKAVAP